MPSLSSQAEEGGTSHPSHDPVLQRDSRESADLLYFVLVRQLYSRRETQSQPDCENSRENDWCLTATATGHLRRALCGSILKDCTHPFYGLFTLMQSEKNIPQYKNQNNSVVE